MKNKMTAREFYQEFLKDFLDFEKALSLLSIYTGNGVGYFIQFPDAYLPLAEAEDDYVDFFDNFDNWNYKYHKCN